MKKLITLFFSSLLLNSAQGQWEQVLDSNLAGGYFEKILTHKNYVFAYSGNAGVPKLYRSSDHASSWVNITANLNTVSKEQLRFVANSHAIFATYFKQIIKSTDGGETWTVDSVPFKFTSPREPIIFQDKLCFVAQEPQQALTYIFIADKTGSNWTRFTAPADYGWLYASDSMLFYATWDSMWTSKDANDFKFHSLTPGCHITQYYGNYTFTDSLIYSICGDNIYSKTLTGSTFMLLSPLPTSGGISQISSTGDTVFVAQNNSGVLESYCYYTINHGLTWNKIELKRWGKRVNPYINHVLKLQDGNLLMAAFSSGLFKTTDLFKTYREANGNLYNHNYYMYPLSKSFVISQDRLIFKYEPDLNSFTRDSLESDKYVIEYFEDKGKLYRSIVPPYQLFEHQNGQYVHLVTSSNYFNYIGSTDAALYFKNETALYRLENNQMKQISNYPGLAAYQEYSGNIVYNNKIFVVGTVNAKSAYVILSSSNDCASWNYDTAGIGFLQKSGFHFLLMKGRHGAPLIHYFNDSVNVFYRYQNGKWQMEKPLNLPPKTSPGILYFGGHYFISTQTQLFRSHNLREWTELALPEPMHQPKVYANHHSMLLTSKYSGIWKLEQKDLPSLPSNKSELQFELYPNPTFNQHSIRAWLPANASVKVELFSIQGQQMNSVEYNIEEEDEYLFTYDISQLSTGFYFYRINVSGKTYVLKFVKI